MKILMLCSKQHWLHKMSRVRFHAMDAIAKVPCVKAFKDGPGFEGWKSVPESVAKHEPDVIFWYKPLEMKGYDEVTIPRIISYNEMWDNKWTTEEITKSNSEIVVCHHENDVENYKHLFRKHKFIHLHHCAEKKIFKDYGLKKEYDILFTGSRRSDFYPVRCRILKVAEEINCKLKIREKLHWEVDNVEQQVVEYAKELNKAEISIACSSKYKYAMAKYSEMALSDTLIVADIPNERQDFFREFVVEIEDKDTDEDIKQKLCWWLEHSKERKARVMKGAISNLATSVQEHYAKKFIDVVKNLLKWR